MIYNINLYIVIFSFIIAWFLTNFIFYIYSYLFNKEELNSRKIKKYFKETINQVNFNIALRDYYINKYNFNKEELDYCLSKKIYFNLMNKLLKYRKILNKSSINILENENEKLILNLFKNIDVNKNINSFKHVIFFKRIYK